MPNTAYHARLAAHKLKALRGAPPRLRSWESAERILAMNGAGMGQKAIKTHHARGWECQNEDCGWITEPLDAATAPAKCANCGSIQIRPVEASLHYVGGARGGRSPYTAADFALDFHSWAALASGEGGIATVLRLWAEQGLCADCHGETAHCAIMGALREDGQALRGNEWACDLLDRLKQAWYA